MWSSGSAFLMSSSTSVNESPLHSIAQYIEDYMDLVENVPNDIARQITQLHEHNHRYHQLLAQLESTLDLVCNRTTNEMKKKNSLLKIQRSLIEIQEIADEKLLLIQSILDQLDGKARQLDFDYRSVTYNSSSNVTNHSRVQIQASLAANNYPSAQRSEPNSTSTNGPNSNAHNNNQSSNDSISKEVVNGTANGVVSDGNGNGSGGHSGKRASARRNTTSRGNNDSDNNSSKRSVKRGVKTSHKEMKRSRNSVSHSNNSLMLGNSSPSGIYEGAPIDPDEPTYCLCDQVSFGEMICCDNSDCKIEWFHFSCVSLNTKPKGKWFCPNCRGDRSNIQKK